MTLGYADLWPRSNNMRGFNFRGTYESHFELRYTVKTRSLTYTFHPSSFSISFFEKCHTTSRGVPLPTYTGWQDLEKNWAEFIGLLCQTERVESSYSNALCQRSHPTGYL
jgi:hypothetical protein